MAPDPQDPLDDDPPMLKGMGPAPEGGWQVELTGAHETVLAVASSMREMLDEKDSENYVEAYFKAAGDPDGYYLTVRRENGLSPHRLRQLADQRADRLAAALNVALSWHDGRSDGPGRDAELAGCRAVLDADGPTAT